MLRFLFPRLTDRPARGADLFAAVTREARQPHWYADGGVPDTLDGRFAVLATVTALVLVRLESGGEPGDAAGVALTERFVAVMEAEHRELGLGDPGLGRKVRKLVSALGRRVESWRAAVAMDDFAGAAVDSLGLAGTGTASHNVRALHDLWARLKALDVAGLADGRLR
ncbi:ubiquinol-cytochrome C chaperone family protein [Sphingomonas sp.]|uniref:ubiquinol-cytochrome C chaperone family protein n=1 Tax=Sphingomonas sp. TaxID=28214 RepID=UPI0025FCA52E|nr:ubiquinol-cytochrome C chaperone family protein [Sphingomonas sp.]MBV9526932.1 ubiquinol-cytochrome C chaperone [Sphingomonas sp.]